jgi:hypothetical protein
MQLTLSFCNNLPNVGQSFKRKEYLKHINLIFVCFKSILVFTYSLGYFGDLLCFNENLLFRIVLIIIVNLICAIKMIFKKNLQAWCDGAAKLQTARQMTTHRFVMIYHYLIVNKAGHQNTLNYM